MKWGLRGEMKLKVRQVNYHVDIQGGGPPLILLHGFTGSSKTWKPFMEEWSASFTTIAIDFLGHGLSDIPRDYRRYTMEETLADLSQIMDQLGINKAHVLGYSMGGRVAVALASTYPDKIDRLILESTSPGLETEEERSKRRKQDEALALEIEQKGIGPFVEKWENLPLFATQKQLPHHVREKVRQERLAQSPQGLANSLRGLGTGNQPSYWPALKKFSFPVLILAGAKDTKYCHIARQMARFIPQATLKIVPCAGHTIHLEKPQFFAKVVVDYLFSTP